MAAGAAAAVVCQCPLTWHSGACALTPATVFNDEPPCLLAPRSIGAIMADNPGVSLQIRRELPPCALDNDVIVEVRAAVAAASALQRAAAMQGSDVVWRSGWVCGRSTPSSQPAIDQRPAALCRPLPLQVRGEKYALMAAVELLSHVLREHPILERPGGAPPSLRAGIGAPAAGPPAAAPPAQPPAGGYYGAPPAGAPQYGAPAPGYAAPAPYGARPY